MNSHFSTSGEYYAKKHREISNEQYEIQRLLNLLEYIKRDKVQQLADVLAQLRDKRKKHRRVRLR